MDPTPTHGISHRLILATLGVAAFAYSVQQTLVLPALPVLQRDLHTSETWADRLSRRPGHRRRDLPTGVRDRP